MTDTSREAFESSPICAGANFAMTNGVYANPTVNRMWMGWQASRVAQAVEPDAIGCKCSVCGGWQRWTPSGMVCSQGHGGAPGVNTRLFTHPAPPATPLFGDLIAAHDGLADELKAQQVAVPVLVPMSGYEISKWWASENGLEDCDMCIHGDFAKVVRAIEAHHGIGAKP